MKKIFITFFSIILVFLVLLKPVQTSASMVSSIKGFDVDSQFETQIENEHGPYTIAGTSYTYGDFLHWGGTYSYYEESTDIMFIYIVSWVSMNPLPKTGGSTFRNKELIQSIEWENDPVNLNPCLGSVGSFFPENQLTSYIITAGVELNGESNNEEEAKLGYKITYQTTTTGADVTRVTSLNDKRLQVKYTFDTSMSTPAVLGSFVSRIGIMYYIPGYRALGLTTNGIHIGFDNTVTMNRKAFLTNVNASSTKNFGFVFGV